MSTLRMIFATMMKRIKKVLRSWGCAAASQSINSKHSISHLYPQHTIYIQCLPMRSTKERLDLLTIFSIISTIFQITNRRLAVNTGMLNCRHWLSLIDFAVTSSRNKTYQSRTKERTYDVNLTTSQMISYDPLADEHLQDYFNSPHTRKHLVKLGLVCEI